MKKTMLSSRQQAILRFLYSQSKGFYPTVREICQGTQTSSTSIVEYHLEHGIPESLTAPFPCKHAQSEGV
jgi:SOS-response transcriptional repressor LexA